MSNTFVWYELMTPDTEAAKVFYGDLIGWQAQDMAMPGMNYTLFKVGDAQVAGLMTLGQDAKDRGVPPCWTGYIGVDDVDAKTAEFVAAGGAVHHGPDEIPGVGRFSVVADPQGAVVCLFKPAPGYPPAPELPPRTPGRVGWRELYTADLEGAVSFYTAHLGWSKREAMDMGEMGPYQLYAVDDGPEPDGGMMKRPPGMPVSAWTFYFNVPDINVAVDKIKAAGGKVLHGPVGIPGGGWIAQAMDPQGAMFAVLQP